MTSRPDVWFKFFHDDWWDGTRDLTPEQRGIYIDMIVLQMREECAVKDDYRWLGFKLHISERKAKSIVESLIAIKKIRRDADGLHNDRADSEIENKHKIRVQNTVAANIMHNRRSVPKVGIELGSSWDRVGIELGNQLPNFGNDKKSEQNQQNDTCGRSAQGAAQGMPRARVLELDKKESKKDPLSPPGGMALKNLEIDSQFSDWWAAYPGSVRKVGKGECSALFRQLVTGVRRTGARKPMKADGMTATAAELIAGACRYAATRPAPDYVPSPITWLNQGRWLDLVDEPKAAKPVYAHWWMDPEKLALVDDDGWRRLIAKHAGATWSVDKIGPPPGNIQCVVPRHIVAELRLEQKYTTAGIARN